jgi:Family of unknown function (DUF5686)/CarboxypepD_reg-like domain
MAQKIEGRITDPSGDPLAFVTVIPNDSSGRFFYSDIEGRFSITPGKLQARTLSFRYVGYENATVQVRQGGMDIVLKISALALGEVNIVAGENPADILMRKAIAQRHRNNPERREGYSCLTYNKVALETVPNKAEFDAIKKKKKDTLSFQRMEKSAKEHQVFLVETVTERSYRQPNMVQENVVLNRASGVQNMGIVAVANAVQPFSFYGDFIPVLDKNYVNPVSPGSPAQYFFNIEDTLFSENDTIWTVSFKPRKGKIFMALQGVLHIHSDAYAVQTVQARAAFGTENLDMKLEQLYTRVDSKSGKVWFPAQLNFELEMPRYPTPFLGLKAIGRSYITDALVDEVPRLKQFNPEQPIVVMDEAENKADSAWSRWHQLAPLQQREKRTYVWMDSIAERKNFAKFSKVINALSTGVWPLSNHIGFSVRDLLKINDFEGLRLGAGLTNAQHRPLGLARRLEWNAYGGYGFRDQRFKYGASGLWRISRALQTQLRIGYENDLLEPGTQYELSPAAFVNRRLYARRMDAHEEWYAQFGTQVWPGARAQVTASQQSAKPLGYTYRYSDPESDNLLQKFDFQELNFMFRYAYGEQVRTFLGSNTATINRLPVIEVGYTKGLHLGNGLRRTLPYERISLALYQSIFVRRLGHLRWRMEAGTASANAPMAKLFTLNQLGRSTGFFALENTFQALPDTLFLHNRFVNAYIAQDLGPILYQHEYSAPQLTLLQNFGWGELQSPERHRDLGFRSLGRPIFESGIRLDNLIRYNYVNFAHMGFGVALYYRWGVLAMPQWQDNVSIRLATKFNL